MDRPRNITLALLNCPELRGVSAEAEILAHRLPLVCDDFGRARVDYEVFVKKLFPRHPEARRAIEYWCEEIEESGFIERYRAGTSDCIRLRRWGRDQAIADPRPSELPPSPGEPVQREGRESARKPSADAAAEEPSVPPSPSPLPPADAPPHASAVEAVEDERESVDARLARLHGVVPHGRKRRSTACAVLPE